MIDQGVVWSCSQHSLRVGRTVALHTVPENTRPGRVCNLAICLIALLLFIGESDANPDSRRRQFGKASHGQLAFMCVAHGQSAL